MEAPLYPISVEGLWGFIDASGNVVIEPQFRGANRFSEGLARVVVFDEEVDGSDLADEGFIDRTGRFVIGPGLPPGSIPPGLPSFYSYSDFYEGRARLWIGDATGLGGYIDRVGQLVIDVKFRYANDFSEGLARVSPPRKDGSAFGPHLSGFVNINGEYEIQPDQKFQATGFSGGRCVVSTQDDEAEWHFHVIDRKGDVIVPSQRYWYFSPFVRGLSRVVLDGKMGCIDADGNETIALVFDQLWEFEHNDLTTAKRDGKHLVIDRRGSTVAEINLPAEAVVGTFHEGLARVDSEKHGFVDERGELKIDLLFDYAENFSGPLALVTQGEETGYINQDGKYVWKTSS